MSKRPRPDETQAFSFGFAVADEESTQGAAATATAEELPLASQSGLYAVVTREVGGSGWGCSSGESSCEIPRNSVLRVKWTHPSSNGQYVWVAGGGKEGCIPASALQLLPSETDRVHCTPPSGPMDHPTLHVIDTVLPSPGSQQQVYGMPLVIEPGLDSLVWPLTPEVFLRTYYRQRALAVHASTTRLSSLTSDLSGLSIPAMIAESSKCVVWMKEQGKGGEGKMQYLDSPPTVGEACFKAGHSLYFNPPTDTQAKYMRPLCRDLGLHSGLEAGSLGGDIEIFAVQGKHRTPWHWDGQENITLQLTGTKRWRVRPSGLADPVTNLHPGAAGEAPREDWKMHAACAPLLAGSGALLPAHLAPGADPAQESAADPSIRSVVLRPGSMLYVPSGWWHAVDAEDEEEGSLSLNFSCVGSRWVELLVRRLVPYLLGADARWRGRLPALGGQEQIASMMADLPQHIRRLSAGDLLPPISAAGGPTRELLLLPAVYAEDGKVQVSQQAEGGMSMAGRHALKRRRQEDSDDEKDDDPETSEHDSSRWQRASSRCYDLLATLPPWPATHAQRRPCVTLCMEGAHRGKPGVTGLTIVARGQGAGPLPYAIVSATLHAGYGSGTGEPQASDRSLALHCGQDMLPLLHKLAGMNYFATVPVAELYAMVEAGEREQAGALLRILEYAGYLAAVNV